MQTTIDKLLGLADRFAILFADAREARMVDLPGSILVDDAKRAKSELESALRVALGDEREACAMLCEEIDARHIGGDVPDHALITAAREIRQRSNGLVTGCRRQSG
jgi:hypothetical protein